MAQLGHQDDLKEKVEFIQLFKIVLGKTASVAWNGINASPQTEATTFKEVWPA